MGRSYVVVPDTFVYERGERGFGDALFLRQAIIKNMKQFPLKRHVVHIYKAAPIFVDIDGLEIVELRSVNYAKRIDYSQSFVKEYGRPKVFELSRPCAEYETENMPYVTKSRQEIFCDVIGVKYEDGDYDVKFFEEELEYADKFLRGRPLCIGVHVWSADKWRDYVRMPLLIERLAKEFDGSVVTFDSKWRYSGNQKNVISCTKSNIRKSWAVMSRMVFGIGPDSWGVHAWGSVGVPLYGIYGPTDPHCRLLYSDVHWSPRYDKCKHQYCWYTPCQDRLRGKSRYPCLNVRTSGFYLRDIKQKMWGYLG